MVKGLIKVGLVGLAGYGVYKLTQVAFGMGLIMGNKEIAKTVYDAVHGKISEEEGKAKVNEIIKENIAAANEYVKEMKEAANNEVKEESDEAANVYGVYEENEEAEVLENTVKDELL